MKRNSSRGTLATHFSETVKRMNKDKATHHRAEAKPENARDIAIIGMACRLPGADHYAQFWNNLVTKTDSISELPKDRWDWSPYFGDPDAGRNKSRSKWGGFIANADKFDAAFFGVSPREAERMDPQQRLIFPLRPCNTMPDYPSAYALATVGVAHLKNAWLYQTA